VADALVILTPHALSLRMLHDERCALRTACIVIRAAIFRASKNTEVWTAMYPAAATMVMMAITSTNSISVNPE
jgi:hypothetical protein